MKLSHKQIIILSGAIWFLIGFYLLQLGLSLLLTDLNQGLFTPEHYPLISALSSLVGTPETAAIILVACALLIGYLKGNYVLGKSARQGVARLQSMPASVPLTQIYSPKYYILLAVMIALGMSIKYLGLNHDIRGFVDTIIGSALINGAMVYFRLASRQPGSCSKNEVKS